MAPVRILNASLAEFGDKKTIILRGVVDPASFGALLVDDYQRERGSTSKASSIWQALKEGSPLPDIELGMRGENFTEAADSDDIELHDKVYLIDGLQRVTTAMAYMEQTAKDVWLGATVHFSTTKEWERERFRILNTQQHKVSPNVLLRNLRETNRAVLTLYGLSNVKDSPLYKKVSWGQNMVRNELITATTVAQTVCSLHRHFATQKDRSYIHMGNTLERVAEKITLQQMRENTDAFFNLVEECWGITTVQYSRSACWLRGGFLSTLARVLSDHVDFWKDDALFVSLDLRRKIKMFPVMDPTVINLASSAGRSQNILYGLMLDHINKGKSTNRLINRVKLADDLEAKRKLEEDNEAAA